MKRHRLCIYEDRDLHDASVSQGMPMIASKPPEVRRDAGNRFALIALCHFDPLTL